MEHLGRTDIRSDPDKRRDEKWRREPCASASCTIASAHEVPSPAEAGSWWNAASEKNTNNGSNICIYGYVSK